MATAKETKPAGVTVTMVALMSGTRDGADWPGPGEKATVSADEAAMLVANNLATLEAPEKR